LAILPNGPVSVPHGFVASTSCPSVSRCTCIRTIIIPLAAVAAKDFEARRYEFHKRLQEDFYAAYRVGELQRYRVQPGDSYWTLCREKFDLPLWLLRHYNAEVNLAALRIHQPLTIPAIERVDVNSPEA
jgi:hypothetical protein